VPYVVAACVAGALGALEQYNRLRSRPTWADHAWALWTLRIVLEAGIGVAALGIIEAATPNVVENPLVWVAAGAAGPAAVRLRIIDVGVRENATPIGLAAAYEPVRDWLARQLDDISASAQSRWLYTELLPALDQRQVPPETIGARVLHWIEGSERFTKIQEVDERDYVKATLAADEADSLKRELIVLRALKLGAYRVLRDLHEACEPHDQG
jgi:hypothetical protein